ncbi:hypothetical protein V1477_008434 [Vespula maculifrons]|uniref:Uncharacterized protein n=1 Tax=Vespula maculifrons TaxID=7453 RepID=A0ABD2CDQ1_VESMC
MQLPPRGGTWVGSTCVLPGGWLHISIFFQDLFCVKFQLHVKLITLYRVRSSRGRSSRDRSSLGDRGTDHPGIFTRKHDRSCLEMSEADGVDGGAICKRGFIHLQFAEKPEAPEAERYLGSWILE